LDLSALGIEVPADLTPETSSKWAVRALFAETFAPPMARKLRRIAEEFRPDVMIRDRGEYASWAVSHALGVPGITLTFGLLPDLGLDANARDALDELSNVRPSTRSSYNSKAIRRMVPASSSTDVVGSSCPSRGERAVRARSRTRATSAT
jgi:hypothetical protein